MKFIFNERYIIADHPEYFACMDEYRRGADEQLLVMHLDVDSLRFTPSCMKRLLTEWNALRACTDAPLFAFEDQPNDDKWAHFVSLLGFEYSSSVDWHDGHKRRVFVSTKHISHEQEDKHEHGSELSDRQCSGLSTPVH